MARPRIIAGGKSKAAGEEWCLKPSAAVRDCCPTLLDCIIFVDPALVAFGDFRPLCEKKNQDGRMKIFSGCILTAVGILDSGTVHHCFENHLQGREMLLAV